MAETIDCAVIGAGVIGLAVARALARGGREVVVVEAAEAIGTGVSSRNSEVIHAGMYYPEGSLKARLCVRGRALLYRYCAERGVEHRRCGKLVVAADQAEVAALAELKARAEANGVDDLAWLEGPAARDLEPELRASAALLSPSSGIVDSHGLMLALQGDAEAAGAVIALLSPVISGHAADGRVRLAVGGAEATALSCAAIDGLSPETIPKRHLAKGNYFMLGGRCPFSRLIYPLPGPAGLGIHFSRDLGGRAKFGPDVQWVEREDYTVDPARAASFYAAIRRYWPALADGALTPGYAGIRPKLHGPGEPLGDFQIQGPDVHGVPGLVNLYGIESPGLTSCLAIAEEVARLLG